MLATRKKLDDDFGLTQVPFVYDPDDYYYIPGLYNGHDLGYLTPVFFNKRVLVKFDQLDEYKLDFASRSYGAIFAPDTVVQFGINPNEKVVFWLGDIAELPLSEQYYLRSENVPSDHRLGSDFYDAQITCVPAKGTEEDHLVGERSKFLAAARQRFGIHLSHLDEETLQAIRDLYPPPTFGKRERERLSLLLNKVCVESLDPGALGSLLSARNVEHERTGSLKRLERLLAIELPDADPPAILSPFFVTYDLRIAHAHLTSESHATSLLASIRERLGLPSDADFFQIYFALITQLTNAYRTVRENLTISSDEGA